MNIVRQRTGTDSAYKQNLYGSGIGIAVLDSGIYPHPDFMNHGSRITAFRDFVNHRQTPYDDNGHGTHIAGIIAGSGYLSEGKYMGMAPWIVKETAPPKPSVVPLNGPSETVPVFTFTS